MNMSNFGISHIDGSEETNPPFTSLELLYEELFHSQHRGTVTVSNDDLGICIEACRGQNAVILIDTNRLMDENGNILGKHMNHLPKEQVLELWKLLIDGKMDEISAMPWIQGFHSSSV